MKRRTCSQKIESAMKRRDKARYTEFNKCRSNKCRKAKDAKADRIDRQITKLYNKEKRTGSC